MNLPLYLKLSGIEVQIVPLESAYLTTPQAGGQLRQEQLEATILLGLDAVNESVLAKRLVSHYDTNLLSDHLTFLRDYISAPIF